MDPIDPPSRTTLFMAGGSSSSELFESSFDSGCPPDYTGTNCFTSSLPSCTPPPPKSPSPITGRMSRVSQGRRASDGGPRLLFCQQGVSDRPSKQRSIQGASNFLRILRSDVCTPNTTAITDRFQIREKLEVTWIWSTLDHRPHRPIISSSLRCAAIRARSCSSWCSSVCCSRNVTCTIGTEAAAVRLRSQPLVPSDAPITYRDKTATNWHSERRSCRLSLRDTSTETLIETGNGTRKGGRVYRPDWQRTASWRRGR